MLQALRKAESPGGQVVRDSFESVHQPLDTSSHTIES